MRLQWGRWRRRRPASPGRRRNAGDATGGRPGRVAGGDRLRSRSPAGPAWRRHPGQPDRAHHRSLRDPGAAGPGRDGHGLPGPRSQPGAAGGHQGAAPRAGQQPRPGGTADAGGARPGAAAAPQRGERLLHRALRGDALLRHGVRARRDPGRSPAARRASCAGTRRWSTSSRPPGRCWRPTSAASSTATSSRRTCWSRRWRRRTAAAHIKVADFGLAAPTGVSEAHFVGSPYYASPEQTGRQAPRSPQRHLFAGGDLPRAAHRGAAVRGRQPAHHQPAARGRPPARRSPPARHPGACAS